MFHCVLLIFSVWNIIQSHPFTVRHGGSDVWGEWAFEKIVVESRTNLSNGSAERRQPRIYNSIYLQFGWFFFSSVLSCSWAGTKNSLVWFMLGLGVAKTSITEGAKEWKYFYLFMYWSHHTACRTLVPKPGTELAPLAVKVWNPNHWSTMEFTF